MTTTIDKNQWCGQFKRCNGCKHAIGMHG
ncbi:TPA: hypothetical protein J2L15_001628 [Escherichia coli]|nr:hypothetical protein [Escherichia coli]HBA6704899.1 hypothetical protein [Escherichia coli]